MKFQSLKTSDLISALNLGCLNLDSVKPEYKKEVEDKLREIESELIRRALESI